MLYLNGEPVDPYQIRVADLSGADGAWANVPLPAPFEFAVDPELGRCVYQPVGSPGKLATSFFYGFNAAIGGGDYARSGDFAVTDPAWIVPFPIRASPPSPTRSPSPKGSCRSIDPSLSKFWATARWRWRRP